MHKIRNIFRHADSADFPAILSGGSSLPYRMRASGASPEIEESVIGGSPPAGLKKPVGGMAKRAMDICIAMLVLIAALPLLLAVALAIKLSMGGPVMFAHRRVGFAGETFNCYKFRTMIDGAEEVLAQYLAAHPEAAAEWAQRRKLSHDPRVTFIGRMLRISSLDELPQLLNVLRGDMSCVGPRPIVRDELELYGDVAPHYLRTRPGLTGMWQVSGRDNVSYARRVQLDLLYIENWSLITDVRILFRTAFVLMHFDDAS